MKLIYLGGMLVVTSALLLGLRMENDDPKFNPNDGAIVTHGSTQQMSTFDEFLGVNSVREHDASKINDQYQVARYHRIFAMDSHLFTGEEIITNIKGNQFTVDLSIPHDEYPDDKMGFNPAKGAGGFNFDRFLKEMNESGLISIPVLARNLLYTNVPDNNIINSWQIPYDNGGDPNNPMDYKAYASFLYQFTARYGKNKLISEGGTINPEILKLAPNNEVKAGLDLVFAIEPGNEMDKDWLSEREYASPQVLAAFLSAAIDGHMGMMGPGHGILTADPQMKIVFPSPVDIKSDYVISVLDNLKELRKEASKYGTQVLPEENLILTAHAYPFKTGSVPGKETSDIVENTELILKSKNFIETMRSKYNCPIYLTETGYDKVIGAISPIGAPTTNEDNIDEGVLNTYAQAKHITRLLLSMYGVGYDKTFLFTLKDPVAIEAWGYKQKFSTSGLIRKNGEKDMAWFVVDHLRKTLKGYKLEYAKFKGSLSIMELNNGEKTALIYWRTTNNGSTSSETIPLKKPYSKGRLITLGDYENGFPTKELVTGKNITITVTEFPQIIVLEP